MIQFLLVSSLLQAARESGAVTDDDISRAVLKVIAWGLGILVFCLLVWVFADPQFCFRRQFIELWQAIINLC